MGLQPSHSVSQRRGLDDLAYVFRLRFRGCQENPILCGTRRRSGLCGSLSKARDLPTRLDWIVLLEGEICMIELDSRHSSSDTVLEATRRLILGFPSIVRP